MPFDDCGPSQGLATTAYDRLTTRFANYGHNPSAEQRAAIRDLLVHLERAANGDLPDALYISAIPAGTGKSQSLAAFAGALLDNPAYANTGVLIAVNRITEAKDMAAALVEYRARMCIIASEPEARALGDHTTAGAAQICICTQAAIRRTLKELQGAPFDNARRFHYRGCRRAVMAWDESFAFNRPVVLDSDTVLGLARAMRHQSEEAASTLKRWSADVDDLTGLCSVPDFEGMGIDWQRLEDAVGDRDELVAQVKALAVISGDEGFISRQGAASAVITHYPEIPPGLMPVVVTDASAKVNANYAQMARKTRLVWLQDAPKTYRDMTLRIVPAAASRSVYRDMKTTRARDLLDMAARYVASTPPSDEVLVIGYKGRFSMNGVVETELHKALLARLKPEDQTRVRWLEWGRHTATNDHKHVRRVLLLGLNFIPRAAGHAASGAALDLDLKRDHPTEDQIRAVQAGLLMDSTLQALLRGNARMGVGGDCGNMEAVVPQTKQTGLSADQYRLMFPEVRLAEDHGLMPPTPLKGRLKELSAIVLRRREAGETKISNQSLYEAMSISKQQFAPLVKKPEWQAYIANLGLRPQPLKGRAMGLRLVGMGGE